MKKYVALVLALLCMTVFATAGAIEITDEYIAQYGIPVIDEFGDETIIIPLGTWTTVISTNELVYDNSHAQCALSNNMMARHVHYYEHEHSLSNFWVESNRYVDLPASEYAAEGGMIAKEVSRTASHTLGVSITSGVEISEVKEELSFEYGVTLSFGAGEVYTYGPIPEGKLGRIAYRMYYHRHHFTDTVTYYINGAAWEDNYTEVQSYQNYVDEPSTKEGYFYLQLKDAE